jgi:SAM-dependent methyltransferase
MAGNKVMKRSIFRKIVDFILFPIRAIGIIEKDRWGLSSLTSERFFYVSQQVQGYCLDIGCGKHNRFITEFLGGNGKGIDVYKYEGLTPEHIVDDMSHLPFNDISFDSVTFIANINHVPQAMRDIELAEAFRCLKKGGNIIVTMGNPIAEICTHKLAWLYDRLLGTKLDIDSERGMHEGEQYYLLDREIKERLTKAGFVNIKKKYFVTQWFLNHLFVAWK